MARAHLEWPFEGWGPKGGDNLAAAKWEVSVGFRCAVAVTWCEVWREEVVVVCDCVIGGHFFFWKIEGAGTCGC